MQFSFYSVARAKESTIVTILAPNLQVVEIKAKARDTTQELFFLLMRTVPAMPYKLKCINFCNLKIYISFGEILSFSSSM